MPKKYPSGGDKGTTKLLSGQLVGKNHENFEAVGTFDELSSFLGWSKVVCKNRRIKKWIDQIQRDLFELGGYISGWSPDVFDELRVKRLEEQINLLQREVPELQTFVIPDGCELAARLHIARTVCRRAERKLALLVSSSQRKITEHAPRFINRLGDWLFLAARWANLHAKTPETTWKRSEINPEE